jgi:hypothetical protein
MPGAGPSRSTARGTVRWTARRDGFERTAGRSRVGSPATIVSGARRLGRAGALPPLSRARAASRRARTSAPGRDRFAVPRFMLIVMRIPPGWWTQVGWSERAAKSSPRAAYPPVGYQSQLAQPGDSSTVSPGRAWPAAAGSTASAIDAARRPVARPVEHLRRRRRRASPIATTARTRSCLGGHRREVETLVAAACDQHDRSNARIATDAACGVVALESSYH